MTEEVIEVGTVLDRTKVFIAHSIYQYIPHIDYHPMDVAALVYYAICLDIAVPTKVEERTEKFLFGEISRNYSKMPAREIFWGISYLLEKGHSLDELSGAIHHIFSFQNENGGIGFYEGDVSRIPGTGWLLSTILSEKHENGTMQKTLENKIQKAATFLVDEWVKDVSIGHALSYKGAYVLTSLLGCVDFDIKVKDLHETIKETVKILLDMQSKDGSWTFLLKQSDPRISSALSSPHITARVMLSMCRAYKKEKNGTITVLGEKFSEEILNAIKRGAQFLCETQSELGFWYAHDAGELAVINGQGALALQAALEVLPR
jgi:hypothetical protein